jgi:hypothetical protein
MQKNQPLKRNRRLDQEIAEEREVLERIKATADVSDLKSSDLMFLARRRARRELYYWAVQVADRFLAIHYRYRFGDGVEKDFGGYWVRVEPRAWTISIEWYFSKGRGKNLPPKTEYIALPFGSKRLSKNQLRKAKAWELPAILEAEAEFEKIRRCCEQLKAMTKMYLGFSQIIGSSAGDDGLLPTWEVED